MNGDGTIWPEYWIACKGCSFSEPLACSKSPAREARKRGWRRQGSAYTGAWVCRDCAAKADTAAKTEVAL